MPSNTHNNRIDRDQSNVDFSFFLAKPLIGWSPVLCGMHSWMHGCSAVQASIQKEWLGFVERRVQEDVALQRRLSETKGVDEAWRHYCEFFERAVDDYRAEYAELTKLSSTLASETVHGTMQVLKTAAPAPVTNGADTTH